MISLTPFEANVWRLLPVSLTDRPAAPAAAPEGRFHHSGQIAAYASLSAEGARVAMRRYAADGMARVLVPMRLAAQRVVDRRGEPSASLVWQDYRARGESPPTWGLSDAARKAGAQAMIYASRTRPELAHVVVFDPACLTCVGPAEPFAV